MWGSSAGWDLGIQLEVGFGGPMRGGIWDPTRGGIRPLPERSRKSARQARRNTKHHIIDPGGAVAQICI